MRRNTLSYVLFLGLAAAAAAVASTPSVAQGPGGAESASLVLLVRHAEPASDPADDPPLSAAGKERARALADALRDTKVAAVITTQLRRTRDTAQPLAEVRGLTPKPIAVDKDHIGAHVTAVVEEIRRHPGEAVLVVGHTDTVPAIIAALQGIHAQVPDICKSQHANLFVVVARAKDVHVVHARYGAPDSEPDCK